MNEHNEISVEALLKEKQILERELLDMVESRIKYFVKRTGYKVSRMTIDYCPGVLLDVSTTIELGGYRLK